MVVAYKCKMLNSELESIEMASQWLLDEQVVTLYPQIDHGWRQQFYEFRGDSQLCGFNNQCFDDPIIHKQGIITGKTIDLLPLISKAVCGSFSHKHLPTNYIYTLSTLASANKLDCVEDTRIILQLWERLVDGTLIDPNDNRFLKLTITLDQLITTK